MNTSYNTLFLLLLLLTAGTLDAQHSLQSWNNFQRLSTTQYDMVEGGYVPGEAIVAFKFGQSASQKQNVENTLLNSHLITVKEWSPSGKYALLSTQNVDNGPCGYDGNGNPFGFGTGGGDARMNFLAGTDSYDDDLDCGRVEVIPTGNGFLFTADYSDYSPTGACQNDDQIVPSWSAVPINTARVAIIDSGIKGLGRYGSVNGVSVSQKVIPASCSSSVCDSYYPSVAESSGFNSHGRSIASLITGWFRALNLESRLRITSYKVLDSELKSSAFQVIKAIEEATADGNQIISLSLGIKSSGCSNGGTVLPDFPYLPNSRKFLGHSPLYYAMKDAEDAGVIIVASAGNGNDDLGMNPQYPAAETGLHNLVTVGALACKGNGRVGFSNYSNKHVDLFTTGENIPIIDNLCLRELSGTSFACPIVSAKAALHITMLGGRNPMGVLCQLRGESRPFWGAKYGIVDSGAPFQDCNKTTIPKSLGKSNVSFTGEAAREVVISPNPFRDRLTIAIPGTEALLTITDARGVRVMQREARQANTTLDLGALKQGVYWVSVHSATGTETKSIVKQ